MTDINLLNDITNPAPKEPSLKRLFSKSAKSKPQGGSGWTRAVIFFALPVVACLIIESMFSEWAESSLQKLAQKLTQKESQALPYRASPPDTQSLETALHTLAQGERILQTYTQSVSISQAKEYLMQMTEALPDEVWVKHFTITYSLPTPTIEVEGYAYTSESVLLFLSSLRNKPLFRFVHLTFSEPTKDHRIPEHRFHMKVTPLHTTPNESFTPAKPLSYNDHSESNTEEPNP